MRTWILVTMAAATFAFAVACGGGDDEKTIDLGDGDSVSVSTDLPDDFPDSFPVYDGADLQGAVRGEQGGVEGIVATWTSGDDFDDIVSFYEDAFSDGDWTSSTNGSAGGSTFWIVEERDGDKVGYVAISEGDEVAIIAAVGDDPNLSSDTGGGDASDDDASGDGSDDASGDGGDDGDDGASGSDADLPDEVALPDDFPTDLVPIPDGARITTANTISAGGAETFTVGFYTKDSAEEVGEFYKDALEGNGFTQSIQTSDATSVYAAYSENPDGTGAIVVISVNDGTIEGYREGVVQVTRS